MQAHLTSGGELYVTYKLGYDTSSSATTIDSREFDFNISYGIVGGSDTYTATMSSSGTLLPAGAGSSYKVWYIAGDDGTVPGYTSPAIPGLQSGVDDYLDDTPVPLVTFTTSSDASKTGNDTRMIQQLDKNKITLSVRTGDPATPLDESSYKDVMAERNARLVWDSATQTLYYKQDRCPRPTIISLRWFCRIHALVRQGLGRQDIYLEVDYF